MNSDIKRYNINVYAGHSGLSNYPLILLGMTPHLELCLEIDGCLGEFHVEGDYDDEVDDVITQLVKNQSFMTDLDTELDKYDGHAIYAHPYEPNLTYYFYFKRS